MIRQVFKDMTMMKHCILLLVVCFLTMSCSRADSYEEKYKEKEHQKYLSIAVRKYQSDCGMYPNSISQLVAKKATCKLWNGPYLRTPEILDSWGNNLIFKFDNLTRPQAISSGPDGKMGTNDDTTLDLTLDTLKP